jgi:hypothetical protein
MTPVVTWNARKPTIHSMTNTNATAHRRFIFQIHFSAAAGDQSESAPAQAFGRRAVNQAGCRPRWTCRSSVALAREMRAPHGVSLEHPHCFARIDGCRLHWVDCKGNEPSGGPPLVLLHGLSDSHSSCVDLVGHSFGGGVALMMLSSSTSVSPSWARRRGSG